jgi:integrase
MKKRKNEKNETRRKKGDGSLIVRKGIIYLRYWRDVRADDGSLTRKGVWESTRLKITGNKKNDAPIFTKAEALLKERTATIALGDEAKTIRKWIGDLNAIEAEKAQIDRDRPSTLLADAWSAFEKSPRRSHRAGSGTLTQYRSQMSRFVEWIKKAYPEIKEMRQVSRKIADTFATSIGKSLSANRYNKYIDTLKRIWRVLGEEARCDINPWVDILHKEKDELSRRVITIDEFRQILDNASDDMRILFMIGWFTGMRLGDAVNIEWDGKDCSIDLEHRFISYEPRKTKKHTHGIRTIVYFGNDLASVFEQIAEKNRHGKLLPKLADHYKRNAPQFSRRIRVLLEKSGITTRDKSRKGERARIAVGYHSLRHTYVSNQLNNGTPLSLVQAQVGHSNPEMTSHYYHTDPGALKRAALAIPSIEITSEKQTESIAITNAKKIIDELDQADLEKIANYIETKRAEIKG